MCFERNERAWLLALSLTAALPTSTGVRYLDGEYAIAGAQCAASAIGIHIG
jgi:hypothetical protein